MQKLNSFNSDQLPFSVIGDVQRSNSNLVLNFEVSDASSLIQWPTAFEMMGAKVPRANGLWEETCFEMFLQPIDQKKYYEFNFSLTPEWNQYVFQTYREPSPPKESHDFSLNKINWDGKNLRIDLDSDVKNAYSISLTAIIKEKSGTKHFLALVHAGEKPDFHLAKSFILKR